jgi:antitoxin Phd
MLTWPLKQAKSRFSEVVKRPLSDGPQGITVRGEPVAVVISCAEYARLTNPKPGFVEFIRASPMAGGELDTARSMDLTRDITL